MNHNIPFWIFQYLFTTSKAYVGCHLPLCCSQSIVHFPFGMCMSRFLSLYSIRLCEFSANFLTSKNTKIEFGNKFLALDVKWMVGVPVPMPVCMCANVICHMSVSSHVRYISPSSFSELKFIQICVLQCCCHHSHCTKLYCNFFRDAPYQWQQICSMRQSQTLSCEM